MAEHSWTAEQAAAITATGDVLLEASAGTGKTTTIVGKVLWLLGLDLGTRQDGTVIPSCPDPCRLEQIAAITFTEKAAYDLKAKLRKEIQESTRGPELRWLVDQASVGTIHAFCGEILRDHALRLGIDPTFRVLDERETQVQQDALIREILLEELHTGQPSAAPLVKRFGLYGFGRNQSGAVGHVRTVMRDLRWRARRYGEWTLSDPERRPLDMTTLRKTAEGAGFWNPGGKDEELDLQALQLADGLQQLARIAIRRWLVWLEDENLRDFDSLILDARRLLTQEKTRPALKSIRSHYRILIIDEFQDTDEAQRDIAFAIAGLPKGRDTGSGQQDSREESGGDVTDRRPQLFLVGDPKQSIYRFRGADITVWNQTRQILCGDAEPSQLTHNFRSEPQVVQFVNQVCGRAMEGQAAALATETPESAVHYARLVPSREATRAAGLEWLAVDAGGIKKDRNEREARLVASRITRIVGQVPVVDPETGEERLCEYGDISILARKKDSLTAIEPGLRAYGIPYYNTSTGGLFDRQEVLDLVTVLRLIENPHDDLRAFAYLRSPFVGLRDEVLAWIRLDPAAGRADFLLQAERVLEKVNAGEAEWFAAPESPHVAEVEREALRRGLRALRTAHALLDRADPSELLEEVLEATGYRLHLLLRHGADQSLANIERFLALLEDYRHLPLSDVLVIWDRWHDQELGIPQAPLFSKEDDVVTLSTIHTAKGLEWPVVLLAAASDGPRQGGALTNNYWADRRYGPILLPKQSDRGPRAAKLFEREVLEEQAEEARLLYVAVTRARDRLIVAGPTDKLRGYADWLGVGLPDAVEEHQARPETGAPEAPPGPAVRTTTEVNPAVPTRTEDEPTAPDPERQLNLFSHPASELVAAAADRSSSLTPPHHPMIIYRKPSAHQESFTEPPISLAWLAGLETVEAPDFTRPIPAPVRSFNSSATELMKRNRSPEEWELIYIHGVQPVWRFAPREESAPALPPALRGQLIHGVLEKIQEEVEIARILDETISGLDAPELEALLGPEAGYRHALEQEIERVVRSAEWGWYVEGVHYRELPFVHLIGPHEWRQGAYDLFRPCRAGRASPKTPADSEQMPAVNLSLFESTPGEPQDAAPWIIDFKTHQIGPDTVDSTAREYDIQVAVYRDAAQAILQAGSSTSGGSAPPVRVALHFTHPNVAVER